jgi:hypothetical protein
LSAVPAIEYKLTMFKKGELIRGSAIDASAARAAFESLQARFDAVPLEQLQPIRVDIQAAAAVALSVALRDGAPERRALFERLSITGLFEMQWLDSLAALALAAWHTRQQQQKSSGVPSGGTIPVQMVEDASSLRARMLRVLEYYFGDDPTIGAKLSVVRAGSGYQDLANDLAVVADMYEEASLKAMLSRDPMYYRVEDSARARELAAAILSALGLGSEGQAKRLAESSQRAWTLLSQTYDKLRLAGQYIFADQEEVDATYPSLVAFVRAAAARRPIGPGAPLSPQGKKPAAE